MSHAVLLLGGDDIDGLDGRLGRQQVSGLRAPR
jgi:hypothetical protein